MMKKSNCHSLIIYLFLIFILGGCHSSSNKPNINDILPMINIISTSKADYRIAAIAEVKGEEYDTPLFGRVYKCYFIAEIECLEECYYKLKGGFLEIKYKKNFDPMFGRSEILEYRHANKGGKIKIKGTIVFEKKQDSWKPLTNVHLEGFIENEVRKKKVQK